VAVFFYLIVALVKSAI